MSSHCPPPRCKQAFLFNAQRVHFSILPLLAGLHRILPANALALSVTEQHFKRKKRRCKESTAVARDSNPGETASKSDGLSLPLQTLTLYGTHSTRRTDHDLDNLDNLTYRYVVQDLRSTDPTQETGPRSPRESIYPMLRKLTFSF